MASIFISIMNRRTLHEVEKWLFSEDENGCSGCMSIFTIRIFTSFPVNLSETWFTIVPTSSMARIMHRKCSQFSCSRSRWARVDFIEFSLLALLGCLGSKERSRSMCGDNQKYRGLHSVQCTVNAHAHISVRFASACPGIVRRVLSRPIALMRCE